MPGKAWNFALRSSPARGVACALACGLALAVLPAFPRPAAPHARLDAKPAASTAWLDRFNAWRAASGLTSLSENTSWSQGDYDHAEYMVKNDLITHYETPGVPYYSTAGDTAAQNSNIFVSSSTSTSDVQAIDWWMGAPFHSIGMMDPRLTQAGFGSYREVKSGWDMGAAVDVERGNPFTGGKYPVYFPGNLSVEPLTSYSGNEFPDPLQACPGYSSPAGLPIVLQVGGNVSTTAGSHSITENGVSITNCVIDSHSPSVGSGLAYRGGVILIPRQPLKNGDYYVVSVTVNGVPYSWSFTVGSLGASPPHLVVTAPLISAVGTPMSLTVTARNIDGSVATGYTGTVHFASSDPSATLPRDYTFASGDAGTRTFGGIVLRTAPKQSITVTDTVSLTIVGSVTIAVYCVGTCQASSGPLGGRGVNQVPSSAPAPRTADQYPAGSGGHRNAPRQSTPTAPSTASTQAATEIAVAEVRRHPRFLML